MSKKTTQNPNDYWKKNIQITLTILTIWFISSFGLSILFRDWCDENLPNIGNAPFGFWMAQQGSILVFVGLLITYSLLLKNLDKTFK